MPKANHKLTTSVPASNQRLPPGTSIPANVYAQSSNSTFANSMESLTTVHGETAMLNTNSWSAPTPVTTPASTIPQQFSTTATQNHHGATTTTTRTVASSSSHSPVHYYNPQTIYSGTFVHSILHQNRAPSSSSSLYSSTSGETSDQESVGDADYDDNDADDTDASLLSCDQFLRGGDGQRQLHVNTPTTSSRASSPFMLQLHIPSPDDILRQSPVFIFKDDDSSSQSDWCHENNRALDHTTNSIPTDAPVNSSNEGKSDKGTSTMMIRNTTTTDHHDNERITVAHVHEQPQITPRTWEHYNQGRGRIVAQQLLQQSHRRHRRPARRGKQYIDDPSHHQQDGKNPASNTNPGSIGTSLSSQSNDDIVSNNRHRVSNLACQAIVDSVEHQTIQQQSAVLTRNAMVDFSVWENILRWKSSQSNMREDGTCVNDRGVLKDKSTSEETSQSSEGHDDDSATSGVFIKAVSIMVHDFTLRSDYQEPVKPSDTTSANAHEVFHQFHEEFKRDDGFCRRTGDAVACILDVEMEGNQLLSQIRGRAGIIEELEGESNSLGNCNDLGLPWIHLYDDVWMPHYEEYVVRAVHAFSRCLLKSESHQGFC